MALLLRSLVLMIAVFVLEGPAISGIALLAATKEAPLIDVKTSRIYIFVDKKRLGHPHAVEGRLKSGEVTLGAESDAGEIVFDISTFKADTDSARRFVGLKGETDAKTQTAVNENMLGPSVLDVKQFPTATFKVESSKATGKRSSANHPFYELQGTFTLHGTAQPLSVVVEAVETKETTRIRGNFTILQTDFDIKPYSAALGTVGVADELKIWGEIDLIPVPETPTKNN